MSFVDKVALVTGGGSGIGEAICLALGTKGAKVVVVDINEKAAKRVADSVNQAGGQAVAFTANSAVYEDNVAAVKFAVDTYGALNYAVNNAGIGGAAARTADVEVADWLKVIDVNLNGVFYGMKAQIPELLKHAPNASIVNMASVHGTVAAPLSPAYTATKHAVVGLTKNAAAEYGDAGLRINAVGPGYIRTPLLEAHLDDATQSVLAAKHALGRLGTSAEVANLTLFLLSEEAAFVTGSYHMVDGGYTAV